MNKQTSSGILRNVAYGSAAWLLPLALGFVATPLIVYSLGVADYGIYALIVGFIGYSFTFAIGRAITKYIAEFRATGESEKIREVISATLLINLGAGIAGILLVYLSADWLVADLLRIDTSLASKAVQALHISAFVIFLTMCTQAFSAVLQGLHRFDVYAKIANAASLALVGGNVVLAWQGFDLNALLVWCLITTFLSTVAFAVAARKLLPEFGFRLKIDKDIWRLVFKYSSGVVGYQILANLILLFERGWITRRLGPEALTFYAVPMTLSMYVHALVGSLVLVIFPLASELKDDLNRLERLYLKATKVICSVVVFLVTTLIVIREPFLSVYLGTDFAAASSDLLVLHALSFGCAAVLAITWQMTEGLGHPNFNFKVFALCAALCIPLMIVLINPLGSFGVGIARLVGFGTIFFSIFYVEKWIFGSVRLRFWLRLLVMIAAAGVAAAIVESVIVASLERAWSTIIYALTAGAAVYGLVLWLVGFVTEDEHALVRSILRRRNA